MRSSAATVFKTSDTRETVKVARHDHDGVTWIDTPGLDADIGGHDDKAATTAAFREADFLFLVHQVTAGELDRSEITTFHRHARQDKNYRAKMLLVLTQIDQLELDEVDQVTKSIGRQLMAEVDLRDLPVVAVSAVRYGRAIAKNDRRLREVRRHGSTVRTGSSGEGRDCDTETEGDTEAVGDVDGRAGRRQEGTCCRLAGGNAQVRGCREDVRRAAQGHVAMAIPIIVAAVAVLVAGGLTAAGIAESKREKMEQEAEEQKKAAAEAPCR